jgi:hypothetical protein
VATQALRGMRYCAMTYAFWVRPRCAWGGVAIILCVLAGGCTMSYHDVLERGHKYTAESTRKPPEVADCVTERMKRYREWQLTRRPLDDRGSVELIVGSGEGVAAIAHVRASPYGSSIESWVSQRAVLTRDILHEEFFGPC